MDKYKETCPLQSFVHTHGRGHNYECKRDWAECYLIGKCAIEINNQESNQKNNHPHKNLAEKEVKIKELFRRIRLFFLRWYYSRDFVRRRISDNNYSEDDWQ